MVPVVSRVAAEDDEICGFPIPKGAHVVAHIGAVHDSEWESPQDWRPERFLPGGEYDSFDDSIRPHKVLHITVQAVGKRTVDIRAAAELAPS